MKKNKLFTLFSLTLLSMGTPLTSIAQAVAISQNTPAITTASNEETEKTQDPETKPVPTDEDQTGKAETESVITEQEKSEKQETETKDTEEPKNEKITPSEKKAIAGNPGHLKNDRLIWGDAPWSFDNTTGSLTINSGTLGQVDSAPWNRDDNEKIDAEKIKKIVFTGTTKAPEDATDLFKNLTGLTEIEALPNLDTSDVSNMTRMFDECTALTALDLSNFNTEEVTSMLDMFRFCTSLTSLELKTFNTKNVTDMRGMFRGSSSLISLDIASLDTSKVTIMRDMFSDISLVNLTLGDAFKFVNTDSNLRKPRAIVSASDLKREGKYLTDNWIRIDDSSATYTPDDFTTNYGKGDLQAGTYVAEIKPLLWGDAPWAFDSDTSSLTISSGTLGEAESAPWNKTDNSKIAGEEIKKIVFTGETKAPVNATDLFKNLTSLTEIAGLNNLDTSDVTNMTRMFDACAALTTLDLSNFNTAKVTNMLDIFRFCTSLISLDLKTFKTKNVTDMRGMFRACSSLTSLTLGDAFRFNGDNVDFPTPAALKPGDQLTGKWIKMNRDSYPYSPADFVKEYGKNDLTAGTYVAEIKAPLLWGDAPYTFDKNTGTLTIESGRLGQSNDSPWNRQDDKVIDKQLIKKIIFTGPAKAPKSCLDLFAYLTSLEEFIGLTNFDTSEVDNMAGMFRDCVQLRSVDFSKLDTSNTTGMNGMFRNCKKLQSLDLSNFDTAKVTNMQMMFSKCLNLNNLDLSSFNTANVQRMDDMFTSCYSLTSLDLSNFNTAKVTNMQNMFIGAFGLKSLNISNFDSSALPTYGFPLNRMLLGADSLSSLTLGDKFSMSPTDYGSASLPNPISQNSWEKSTGKWMRQDGNSKAYNPTDFMANYGKGDLTAGTYIAEVNPTKWGDAIWTFDETTGTLTVNSGTLEAGATTSPWKRTDGQEIDASRIRKIVFTGKIQAPENSDSLFSGLSNLTEIVNLTNLDTSKVTDMSHMFIGCKLLKTLDLSQFNTSNVSKTEWMFQNCASLTELNLKSFDTSKLTKMWMMFSGCASLTSLDLSNFDTKSVVTMGKLFYGCSSLTSVNLSSFETSQVTHMGEMFQNCTSLTSIDLSSFDTGNVTTMQNLFKNTPLASLTLGVKFKSMGTYADLPIPTALNEGDQLTGNWIRKDGQSKAYSPTNFMANYGKGDLQAGTYVGELISSGAILETNISFSTDSGKTDATIAVIGDQLQATLTVKHSEKSPTDATANDVKLSTISLLTDALTLSSTVTVITFDQTGKQTASNEQTIKNNELSLPALPFGSYVEITLTGTAWEMAYAIPGGNYNYTLSYKNQSGDKKVKKSGNFVISSGALSFKSVPNISFKDSVLPINSNQIIDRKDTNYAITVEDYRGARLPDGVTTKPDRLDWEITATASPFKDAAGKTIKLSTMAVSFTKAIGQTTELGADATLITSHDVTDETARDNHLTKLSWAKELGFNIVVHNRTDLDTTKYTADVAFDLRTAP